jgi:hypothetical protein
MNKLITMLITSTLLVSLTYADSNVSDPEDWYKNSYAVLWLAGPNTDVDKTAKHYDKNIVSFESTGEISKGNSREWIEGLLKEWAADNWVSSELAGIKVDRLNETTVAFKSRWHDKYSNRDDEYTCSWYLANWREDRWVFTNYTDIDCATHGF